MSMSNNEHIHDNHALPMSKEDSSKQFEENTLKMEILPQFTDDYIDEWVSEGNNIDGLHRIIDDFADRLLAAHQKAIQERVRSAEIDLLYKILEVDDGQKGNDYKVFQAVYKELCNLEQPK